MDNSTGQAGFKTLEITLSSGSFTNLVNAFTLTAVQSNQITGMDISVISGDMLLRYDGTSGAGAAMLVPAKSLAKLSTRTDALNAYASSAATTVVVVTLLKNVNELPR